MTYKRKRSIGKAAAYIIISAYTIVLVACGLDLLSDQDDVNLGVQMDKEIRSKSSEYPILRGHDDVRSYVVGIVQTVLNSPEIKKKNVYPYKVEIIADDKTVNAFCTPGGYIYVYTGLMKFLDNEASFAGVIGHEIAHAELRHASKRITAAYGVQILISIALGQNPTAVESIVANLFTQLGFLQNSRSDETEADDFSMRYLRSTPYYPGAIRYFFDKINAGGKGSAGSLEKLFSTHPPSNDRLANVKNTMVAWKIPDPTETNLMSSKYMRMRNSLP